VLRLVRPLHCRRHLRDLSDIGIFGYHFSAGHTFALVKLVLCIGALLSVLIPSFKWGPKRDDLKPLSLSVTAATSLTPSIEAKRRAWLTAIQNDRLKYTQQDRRIRLYVSDQCHGAVRILEPFYYS